MALSDYARSLASDHQKYNIIDFATQSHGLGIPLFPSQRFFLKVFEKIPLDDTVADIRIPDKFNERVLFTLNEKDFFDYLYNEGRISLEYDTYMNSEVFQYQFAIGRRGTKSTTFCIYIAYKLYEILNYFHPQTELFNILENGMMNVTMAALGQSNSDKLFSKFYGIIKDSPFFKPHMKEEANSNICRLWTKRDLERIKKSGSGAHTHSIEISSVPNTPGVRGEDNVMIAMEEFAHFNRSAKSTRSEPLDEAIYKALTPSVAGFKYHDGVPFGRVLILSSPNGKTGKFWDEFRNAFELGVESGSLAIQAPTWECNPEISPIFLKTEWKKSPASFRQEFGAEFTEGGKNWIEDLDVFYKSFDVHLSPVRKSGRNDRVYFMGLDFALSNDGTAVAISHYEPEYEITKDSFLPETFSYDDNLGEFLSNNVGSKIPMYVIDYAEARYAGQPPYENHKVLLIEELIDWIEDLFKFFPIQYGVFDQWSGEIIKQSLDSRGLKRLQLLKHDAILNDAQYKLFSQLMYSGQMKLPHSKSIENELLSLKCDLRANNIIKVEAPSGGILHDDLFDAMIRSLYLCYYYHNKNQTIASGLPGLYGNYTIIKRSMADLNKVNRKVFPHMQSKLHKTNNLRKPRKMK